MRAHTARPHAVRASDHRPRQGCARLSIGLCVSLLLILAGVTVFAAWLGLSMALAPFEGRIYPHVYAAGVDLGGLSPEDAVARLNDARITPDGPGLVLRDGDETWTVPWGEMGVTLDVEGTVQAALAVGRTNGRLTDLARILAGHYEVAPVFRVDPEMARSAMQQLADRVSVPPTEATIHIDGATLTPVPGKLGRALDVEATLENIVHSVAVLGPGQPVAPVFDPVLPRVADASPALAEAEAKLSQRLTLSAYDVLTGEAFTWTLGREEIATWLRVEPAEGGDRLRVTANPDAVQATLSHLASQMGEGRSFRMDEAVPAVIEAFEKGNGPVALYITHPERVYTVQPGDRLNLIADWFGMPPGLIAEANPGVDLNWLSVGQQLIIPSQDVLTPYLPVPGKRIEVSLAEQRMRVYENGQLLYDWPVSTGIPSSPTYRGIFQVLDKQEMAYASQWDLWMPHFIAIYRAGGEVYNGIHALPILSNGQRLWEGLLGTPASYGCIILGVEEAETLYNWAETGVLVIVE